MSSFEWYRFGALILIKYKCENSPKIRHDSALVPRGTFKGTIVFREGPLATDFRSVKTRERMIAKSRKIMRSNYINIACIYCILIILNNVFILN